LIRHAKASTAGSNQRQAAGLGRFLRGAFATRGFSNGAKGSGAPFGLGVRTSLRLVGLSTVATAALLALGAPSALAAPPAEFGAEGPGAGEFEEPEGIAIDQESGDVYIVEEQGNRVDRFSESGAFELAFGWGVVDSSPELQVCGPQAPSPSASCRRGIKGSGIGQFKEPAGIAVDNDPLSSSHGDLYVVDRGNQRVEKFGPDGEFILGFGEAGSGPGQFEGLGIHAVAVGPSDTVYVADIERVQKFSPAGALEGEIALPSIGGIEDLLVDSVGDLYVLPELEGQGVRKFDGTGTELGSPRDPGLGGTEPAIAIGPGDELIVNDPLIKGRIFAYDSSGAQLSSQPQGKDARGIAYAEGPAALYVIHKHPARVLTTTLATPGTPLIIEDSEAANEVGTQGATLNATVNPEGGEETTFHFEYGTEAGVYPEETPEEALGTGEGFEDIAAAKAIEGLAPRTTYHFRVVATNKEGKTAAGPDQSFETLPPVSVDSSSASHITATSATLEAELNPHGLPTTYRFEYDTVPYTEGESPHGTATPLGSAGEGEVDVLRSAQVQGLEAGTVYHFRVVAENELGTTEGPNRTFATQSALASALPDNRGWEQVSPLDKHGIPLETIKREGGLIQAAADGHAITYFAKGAIVSEPAGDRSAVNSQVLSARTASGWSTADITTPHQAPAGVYPGKDSEYKLFSADLSLGAVEPIGATPLSPQATEPTPYLRLPGGGYEPLVNPSNVPEGTHFGGKELGPEEFERGVNFVTATPDFSHILLKSPTSLVEGFETGGGQGIYEWSEGALAPVSFVPSGAAALCGGAAPACESAGDSRVGNGNFQVRNAISADGSRIFFSTGPELYLRDIPRGETLRLDAAAPGVEEPSAAGAIFQFASTDGSRVFFTDAQRLTEDSTARPSKPDLYLCEVREGGAGQLECALTDLTPDHTPNESANVLGAAIGGADDGSSVYFVANGALTGEPGPAGETAVHGDCGEAASDSCNLYRYDIATESIQLLAVLSGADFPDWTASSEGLQLGELTARVSPNGRYLAFMSERQLTGYDNRDAKSGARDEEVFLYDAGGEGGAGRLLCASCNPTGARPAGRQGPPNVPYALVDGAPNWQNRWYAANVPGWTNVDNQHALYQSRYLSNSGRLFFNSSDALVPTDTNGSEDVYQYEPPQGPGQPASNTCAESAPTFSSASEGCVSLISSGESAEESAFMDASESGDDVFFLSAAKLGPRDTDTALDLYDARVEGGEAAPAKPVECAGDACQRPVAPPNDPTPGSLTFQGAGNLLQCPRGKVKRSGSCVKQKAKKKHKSKKQKKSKRTDNNRRARR
jgi:hypothetical protein